MYCTRGRCRRNSRTLQFKIKYFSFAVLVSHSFWANVIASYRNGSHDRGRRWSR